jgi:hypothetical protein
MISEHSNTFQSDLNQFVEKINKILIDTSQETFGNKIFYKEKFSKVNRPWFNNSCHSKRKDFHKAKKNFNINKTNENRHHLKVACKFYRAEMNKCFSDYEFRFENELRNTSESNPEELWKILNKFKISKREDKIDIDELYEYFKNLNLSNEVGDSNFEIPDINDNLANDTVNGEITEEEITSAIQSLKNGKAPGYEYVINEYIKSTISLCMPLYLKLFNEIIGNYRNHPRDMNDRYKV